MNHPPLRARVRRTPGGKSLGEFVDRHGLRPVSVYIPEKLHRALAATAIESETSLQQIFTLACNTYYGGREVNVPPLTAPTHPKLEPHKNYTWYADVSLHRNMKMLAVELSSNVQQLVLSAVVNYMNSAPKVRALKIKTGFPAYARAPDRRALA